MIRIGNTEISPADTSAGAEMATTHTEALPTETSENPASEATIPTEAVVSTEETPALDASAPTETTEAETAAVALPERESAETPADALREAADRLMDERTHLALEREMAQVSERFPELKELGDIVRLGRYPEIKGMVGRGYSLSDAVRLAYENVYLARRAKAAALQARTDAYSTSHLHPARPAGEGRGEVSETQIREYLEAIPGASREQAIAAYRKWGIHRR